MKDRTMSFRHHQHELKKKSKFKKTYSYSEFFDNFEYDFRIKIE